MIKPFGIGWYKTNGGYDAKVSQIRVRNRAFCLRGAVKQGENVYILTAWDLMGKCLGVGSQILDLVPKEET